VNYLKISIPPKRFIDNKSPPELDICVALDRLKQWPVYNSGFGNSRKAAIVLGTFPIVLIPIGLLMQ
jgi:hypothetical protein